MTRDEYAAMVQWYRPSLVKHASLYVIERADAEDIADRAIEKCLRQCGKISSTNYRSYFRLVVRSVALDHLYLHRHQQETQFRENDEGDPICEPSVQVDVSVRIDIQRAMGRLSMPLRQIAWLYYVEEWTQNDISARFAQSQKYVSRKIEEINGLLRISLQAYAPRTR